MLMKREHVVITQITSSFTKQTTQGNDTTLILLKTSDNECFCASVHKLILAERNLNRYKLSSLTLFKLFERYPSSELILQRISYEAYLKIARHYKLTYHNNLRAFAFKNDNDLFTLRIKELSYAA